MLFYTPAFLVFSLALLGCLALIHRSQPRKLLLLVASYVFYMWWNPAFVLLIVLSTAIDFTVGRRMAAERDPLRRKTLLLASVVSNLGLLGYFKYAGFLSDSLLGVMRMLGFEPGWTSLHVTLPVGISFYTFQTMSYTIDVYRERIPASRSPLDFALFVAFFPQLVAGPIVRAADFMPQLERPVRLHFDQATAFLFLKGLVKKVIFADNVAVFADAIFASPGDWPSAIVWLATLCFAVQIYCDFSGYSDMAIAIARFLGFEIPINFDHPYLARNPSDFWRRWHISLSSWLRDYLYVSLGGNRAGRLRTYRNLMLTMLLGGLWHGASWNFVLWGFLHGALLVAHRRFRELWSGRATPPAERGLPLWISIAAMQYCVLLTWIPFRVRDEGRMLDAMRKFVWVDFDLSLSSIGLGSLSLFSTALLLAVFAALHLFSRRVGGLDRWAGGLPVPAAMALAAAAGAACFWLWPLTEAPFIYFQF
jgi:alginate O-acetyltransferase complex protein AlgI